MRKFLSDMVFFVMVNGLSRAIPLIVLIFLTHYFSPENMGAIESLTAFYLIASTLGMIQMDTGLQRYFYDFEKNIFVNATFIVLFLSIFVSVTLGFLLNTALFERITGFTIGHERYYVAFMPLVLNLYLISNIYLRYVYKSKFPIAIVSILQLMIFSVMVLLGVRHGTLDIKNYFSYLFFSYAVCFVLTVALTFSKQSFTIDRKCLDSLFRFTFPQLPARLISILCQQGNRFVITYILGVSALGIFSISNKLSLVYGVILNAFNLVWYPMIYSKSFDFLIGKDKYFNIVIFCLAVISPVLCFFSLVVYHFYIDERFYSGLTLSWLLLYSSSTFIIKEMVDSPLKIQEKTGYISLSYSLYFIVLSVSMTVFCFIYGVVGAGISMYFSSAFLLLYSCYLSHKICKVKFNVTMIFLYLLSGAFLILLLNEVVNV